MDKAVYVQSTKIFCLPFNGDINFSLAIAQKYGHFIHEFYGDDGLFASGRHGQHLNIRDLAPLVNKLKQFDVKFNYTLNSPNLETYIAKEKYLFEHLKMLRLMGIENITVSHPIFTKMLADMGFHVCCSAVQCISTVPDAKQIEKTGFERIVVAEDINRCINKLQDIISSVQIPLEIVINNVCMLHCPLRLSHYSLDGVTNPLISKETWDSYNSFFNCRRQWKDDPVTFLKGTWIRPEEIKRYIGIGVKYIKIAGRDWSSDKLEEIFKIYFSQEHNGFVFDYLRPGCDIEKKYGIKNLRNRELDDFFSFFFESGTKCDGICDGCNHCEAYARRLFNVNNY